MKENIEEDIEYIEALIKIASQLPSGELKIQEKEIEALNDILSDYKRVLKENEELKIKNNAIKRESEAYAEHMIRLDNELNLEKEKSKYEWIRQNCLPQELVNKLYISIQKVKDKIEKEELPLVIVGGRKNKKTLEYGKKLGRRQALQELLEGGK